MLRLWVKVDLRPWIVRFGKNGYSFENWIKGRNKIGKKKEYVSCRDFSIETRDWSAKDVLTPKHHNITRSIWEFRLLFYGIGVHARGRSLWLPIVQKFQLGGRESQRDCLATCIRASVLTQLWHRTQRLKIREHYDDWLNKQISAQTCWLRSCKNGWTLRKGRWTVWNSRLCCTWDPSEKTLFKSMRSLELRLYLIRFTLLFFAIWQWFLTGNN